MWWAEKIRVYGGELQAFSRLSLGLEDMRNACQYWKADRSVGGSMSSACLKKSPNTHRVPPVYFHVALFWLVVLLYYCVPLAKSSLLVTTTKGPNELIGNSNTA